MRCALLYTTVGALCAALQLAAGSTVLQLKVWQTASDRQPIENNITSHTPLYYYAPDQSNIQPVISGTLALICWYASEEEYYGPYMNGIVQLVQTEPAEQYSNMHKANISFNVTKHFQEIPNYTEQDQIQCRINDKVLVYTVPHIAPRSHAVDDTEFAVALLLGLCTVLTVILLDKVQTFRQALGELWWDSRYSLRDLPQRNAE